MEALKYEQHNQDIPEYTLVMPWHSPRGETKFSIAIFVLLLNVFLVPLFQIKLIRNIIPATLHEKGPSYNYLTLIRGQRQLIYM